MTVGPDVATFTIGAAVSLATSWLLVSKLERVGERLGLSEALLGIVAALAADAPEITAAVSAMASHQQRLGAGVVIGSNVFNLAALLGLGAVVAGLISLHRKVVVLGGTVAMCIAAICLAVVLGIMPPVAGCALGLFLVAGYTALLGASGARLARLRLPASWISWLRSAVAEEETELESAIRPVPARRADVAVAALSLAVVVAASVTMERAASALGSQLKVPEIVIGGLLLAAVTSLPNAVAAVYLASRGRGAATLSTALNSNTLNVVIGLMIPATVLGLGRPSAQTVLIVGWYAGLTVVVLAFAWRDRGVRRSTGAAVIAAYLVFAVLTLSIAYSVPAEASSVASLTSLVIAVGFAAWLISGRKALSGNSQTRSAGFGARWSSLTGQSVARTLLAGLGICFAVAIADAALGSRVILIGLLIVGPCWALLTGRWVPTALTSLCAVGLAMAVAVPDGIWGTASFFTWLAAVVAVASATTIAAAVIQARAQAS